MEGADFYRQLKPVLNKLSQLNVWDSLYVIRQYLNDSFKNYDLEKPHFVNIEDRKNCPIPAYLVDFMILATLKYSSTLKSDKSLRQLKVRRGITPLVHDAYEKARYEKDEDILIWLKSYMLNQFKIQHPDFFPNRIFKYHFLYSTPNLEELVQSKLGITKEKYFKLVLMYYFVFSEKFCYADSKLERYLVADKSHFTAEEARTVFSLFCKDILLINEEKLFTYENEEFGKKYNEVYHAGHSQPTVPANVDCAYGGGKADLLASGTDQGVEPVDSAIEAYNGVPYAKIIEAWMEGRDLTNKRHDTLVELTDHLRYLIGKNPTKITEVVMQLPWVQDLAAEGEDVAGTVSSIMGWRYKQKKPEEVMEALRKSGALTQGTGTLCSAGSAQVFQSPCESSDIYASMPLDKWAEELQEMAEYYPCLKELFLNVHPHKLAAVWFSSAALFGTLMTRAYYHFWYDPEIVRRLNYSIFIIGDPGAGKNVVEKFYKKIADPMIQADKCLIDAVNRYKEGRTERTTSSKAQKGDALKRPVVGIRVHPAHTATGEFIRHMNAAVETIQGHPLNLHMFSFDAELDNVTKQNKGGDWKDREILELKAFHNEEDGQMYANQESVTGMFNVFWNFIYTGTPYALHRKVNQRNFGTGMSTRLAVIPLPDRGLAKRHQQVDPNANETLKTWAYRLDKVEGEIPIEPLNDETYDWQSARLEIAEFNGDKADKTLLKRIPYYGIGISLPFILMRHWDEWQESRSLTMDDKDKRFCRLAMEIQYRCQQFFFGEMAFNYFADQNKEFVQRRRTTRYDECFRKLPDEFKTQQVMDCFGCSQPTASKAITRFLNDHVVEKVKYGLYRKLLQELP